ncbi:MAG: hypothetical protein R2698_13680 [Microthrixaceae bacterium]
MSDQPTTDAPTDPSEVAVGAVADETTTLRDEDVVDTLPEDLDMVEASGDYRLPNNNRRRVPALIYLAVAVFCLVVWATSRHDSPLVNNGMLGAAIALGLFGAYGLVASRTLAVDETAALEVADRTVGFAIGHATAQMVWRGWWSRPVWRLLAYSTENPPRRRAMVVVDGISGDVIEWFAEDNPERYEADGDAAVDSPEPRP